MNYERLLDVATGVAISRAKNRAINFRHGCAALRGDGKIITAYNEMAMEQTWKAHAEARACRKLDIKAVVAVIRITADGKWANSKPCENCFRCMKRKGVERVLYSIRPNEYGTLLF
jgi:pyrimidine deaminase RibD-like protein